MYFDQKIKYLDYLENGIRVRGAGFIRLECWGKTCSLIIQASGLFENAKGSYPVMLVLPEKEEQLSELQLQNGKGRLELRNLNSDDLKELKKVQIPLGETRQLVAVLREEAENRPRQAAMDSAGVETHQGESGHEAYEKILHPNGEQIKSDAVQQTKEEHKANNEVQQTKEEHKANNEVQQTKEEYIADNAVQRMVGNHITDGKIHPLQDGSKIYVQNEQAVSEVREIKSAEFSYQANLRPGKWEQLIAIYPPISPFGDARQYLQISPGDFVILKDRSYRMVNNSFLLHGYFTYRHLILHRQNRRGEMVYYVGVPGRYYDREKEVAILFGFESFEGATEPAREGDFGYYMMRVEL